MLAVTQAFTVGLLLLAITGCNSNFSTNHAYNQLARSQALEISSDYVILGVEKWNRKDIGKERGIDTKRFQLLASSEGDAEAINKRFERRTKQPKTALMTHAVCRISGKKEYIWNPYHSPSRTRDNAYEESWEKGYACVHDTIMKAVRRKRYTHVIISAMGWNNDQEVSIDRIHMIHRNLEPAMARRGKAYNPLIIAITWPSVWFSRSDSGVMRTVGHIGSIFNKEADADEIGTTIGNMLLHKTMAEVKMERPQTKVVVIGHSFGARMLSMAVHSRGHLVQPSSVKEPVDVFVGLQPAFSIKRFIKGESREGAPYAGIKKTDFWLTWSQEDKANPIAFWTDFAGGSRAHHYIEDNRYDQRFAKCIWNRKSSSFDYQNEKKPGQIHHVDATSIVTKGQKSAPGEPILKPNKEGRDRHGQVVSGHNDVFDDDMAELIAEILCKK